MWLKWQLHLSLCTELRWADKCFFQHRLNELGHSKTYKRMCASREDSDQPVHLHSQISLCWMLWDPSTSWYWQKRLWSDCADVQANLKSLLSAHVVMYILLCLVSYEPHHDKTCLMPYASNKDADQSVHPRCLISGFVGRYLDSITSYSKISILKQS